ncbi:MAG TPA: hypothetical protein VFV05_26580 [Methylomirabilota bacterium]|nr:hypothetical protein [Methylomirabilota bacterium]
MKIVAAVLVVALLLIPGVALAGSDDAALALGAFAVFNQLISGTGLFGGVAPVVVAPQPVYLPPPQVYVAPQPVYAPPPVYAAPRPVYVTPPPVVVAPPPPVYVSRGHYRAHGYDGHHWKRDRDHRDWKHYYRAHRRDRD